MSATADLLTNIVKEAVCSLFKFAAATALSLAGHLADDLEGCAVNAYIRRSHFVMKTLGVALVPCMLLELCNNISLCLSVFRADKYIHGLCEF